MSDKFDQVMEKFLQPMSKLAGPVKDSVYFLRRDGCFVFSHGYYHPTPGEFIGKIIYYPTPDGSVDIWGRPYEAMHKAWRDGEHVAILNDVQIVRHYEIDADLDPNRPRPLVADYTIEFPLRDFVGYFDPHHSLERCRELHPVVGEWVDRTAALFDFPVEKMGVTGSLAYGKIEEDDMDFDVIFTGSLEENARVIERLQELAQVPDRRVFEFGKYWPIRIWHEGYLICPFFVYENLDDAPLFQARVEEIRESVAGEGVVADDTHSCYLPIVLDLEEVAGDCAGQALRLICYDGSIRGEYRRGDRIRFSGGRLLEIEAGNGPEKAVAIDFHKQLERV